jgi:hypothetical protein
LSDSENPPDVALVSAELVRRGFVELVEPSPRAKRVRRKGPENIVRPPLTVPPAPVAVVPDSSVPAPSTPIRRPCMPLDELPPGLDARRRPRNTESTVACSHASGSRGKIGPERRFASV